MIAMQNTEQPNPEIRELTDTDLEAISGGNWIGDVMRAFVRSMRNSDERRPTGPN